MSKLSPELTELLRSVDGAEPLQVIVELHPVALPATGTRQERIEAAKSGFARDLEIVRTLVAEAGGQSLEEAWLNRTLRVLLPPQGLDSVAANELVLAIDLPRGLEPDTQEARTNPAP